MLIARVEIAQCNCSVLDGTLAQPVQTIAKLEIRHTIARGDVSKFGFNMFCEQSKVRMSLCLRYNTGRDS